MKKVFSIISFVISTLLYFILLFLPVGLFYEVSRAPQDTLEDTIGILGIFLGFVVMFMLASVLGFIFSLVSAKLACKPWIKRCSRVEFVLFCVGMAITVLLIILMIVNP